MMEEQWLRLITVTYCDGTEDEEVEREEYKWVPAHTVPVIKSKE